MNLLRTLWFWLSFWIMTAILFLKMAYQRTRSLDSQDPSHLSHLAACQWGQWVFHLNPGWDVTVEGRDNLPSNGKSTVFVANHKSGMDICALFVLNTPFRWLSKDMVFKIPLMGQAMRWCGYVPITRGDAKSHKMALAKSIEWLQKGVPMLYFPEGTRSETDVLRPFKMGAFNIANEQDTDITPIVITGTDRLMKKSSFMVQGTSHVFIRILPPMKPDKNEDLATFRDKVRSLVQSHYTSLIEADEATDKKGRTNQGTTNSEPHSRPIKLS